MNILIENKAKESYEKQWNPDESKYECFFHYTDELLYSAGFAEGYMLAKNEIVDKDFEQIEEDTNKYKI